MLKDCDWVLSFQRKVEVKSAYSPLLLNELVLSSFQHRQLKDSFSIFLLDL